MFDDDIPEFAVQGERGIDVFRRLDDESQRRARYRCIATVAGDGALHDHAPEARRDPAALREHAARLREDPLLSAFSLGDPASWPLAAGAADPMRLFLYVDFFRAWQVADLAGARFESRLSRPDGASSIAAADLATGVAPVFDFNRVARGLRLAAHLVPMLRDRVATPGFRDDRNGGTGYALRMLGDLCLRGDEPTLALACFDTAVSAGDNPFRRRKAIEAARAAGDAEAEARHRTGYAARWPLPADLAAAGDAA